MRIEIQDEIQRSEELRYDHRLHDALSACSGMNCFKIAELLGQCPRIVQYWIKCFNKAVSQVCKTKNTMIVAFLLTKLPLKSCEKICYKSLTTLIINKIFGESSYDLYS